MSGWETDTFLHKFPSYSGKQKKTVCYISESVPMAEYIFRMQKITGNTGGLFRRKQAKKSLSVYRSGKNFFSSPKIRNRGVTHNNKALYTSAIPAFLSAIRLGFAVAKFAVCPT